jgi:hypothetical protein
MMEVDNIKYISGRGLWSVEWKYLTQVKVGKGILVTGRGDP